MMSPRGLMKKVSVTATGPVAMFVVAGPTNRYLTRTRRPRQSHVAPTLLDRFDELICCRSPRFPSQLAHTDPTHSTGEPTGRFPETSRVRQLRFAKGRR